MTVAIIGLGGIGASVGLAYQHSALTDAVIGYDIDPEALHGALEQGAIDQPAESVAACADAELIVIATPPKAVPEVFQQLAPNLRPESVLTDVVSLKQPVLAWASVYLPYPNRFVGGHPIAGTEQSGYLAARADLFQGAQWALTPTPKTDTDALERVEQFVRALRAIPVRIDAAQHDREFALLSFLPHCIAFSLVALHRAHPTQLQGGGSWHSATRVAQSDPELWAQLLSLGREPTAEWLTELIAHLERFRDALQQGDIEAIRALLR
ncbi:MAG: prephenate dehydrogenase/arogenate dehydrogenase family protein [Armatimonadota bacterium]|nr:prephenate dehydrogenase/arogenate dehydrogenase family protein [Armatimonadota bacterium]